MGNGKLLPEGKKINRPKKRNLKLRASLHDRFYDKFIPEPNSGCWLWIGGIKEYGYGIIGLGRREEGTDKAHRVSWRIHHGEIPEGMNVLHKCDVPACVNPNHLFLGSLSDNMRDCVNKGRNFTPDNRGEKSSSAILTYNNVADIRKREKRARDYASQYSVKKRTIYAIWRRDLWKDAP